VISEHVIAPHLRAGMVLQGRYEIRKEIGRGGSSIVYLATDRELGSEVAVKLLVPPPIGAETARERMRREVQSVRGLTHPNVVAVYDYLEEGQASFIVMEYVDGVDLRKLVGRRGPLAVADAVGLARGMAAALQAAHGRGILHRDVKPQNLLIDADGVARLVDFGAARLDGLATITQSGALIGTLSYAAPEVLAGERGDARSDLYSLGLTLYFALCGQLPGGGANRMPPAPRPEGFAPRTVREDVPEWLDAIVARSTAADPSWRFPSASSLQDAISAGDEGEGWDVETRPVGSGCLVCGAPVQEDATTCAACAGLSARADDRLIYIRPPAGRGARRELVGRLGRLAPSLGGGAELLAVARGRRPLLRVPRVSADRALLRLGAKDIPAITAAAGSAWNALPASFYALALATVAMGLLTGAMVTPVFLWSGPVVGASLLLLGHRAAQRPLVVPRERPSLLPEEVERRVVETLSRLPLGTARSLLADLTAIVRSVVGAAAREPGVQRADKLPGLLGAACDAALDLASLDESLVRLEAQRARLEDPAPQWMDALARCGRSRDRLVQRFLDAISALGSMRGHLAADRLAEGPDIALLTRELEEDARRRAEAAAEVERLLDSTLRGNAAVE